MALIPARSGSIRISNKNTYPIAGKPLIEYSLEPAIKFKLVDEIHLSSDSKETIDLSIKFGVNSHYLRPERLSNDTVSALDVIL